VLCISSGCYAIYQDKSSLEYHKGRGQEVENILKKCPIEFMTNTKTLDAFHILLIGTKLNFLSMLYSTEFILPMCDIGMSLRKIKKNNQLTTKIVWSQTNFEERETELEQRRKTVELEKQKENERQLEKIKELEGQLEKQNEFERRKDLERQQLEKQNSLEVQLERDRELKNLKREMAKKDREFALLKKLLEEKDEELKKYVNKKENTAMESQNEIARQRS